MSEMIRVTCAPGCHFTMPSPSGLSGLAPFHVSGGEAVFVPAARATGLWEARLILHPVTGAPPPPVEAMRDEEPSISMDGGRTRQSACNGIIHQPTWAATAAPPTSTAYPVTAPDWSPY